jgi:FkbM family methyltransferase
MKRTIYQLAYNGTVNSILRIILLPFSKLLNKRLISISGELRIKYGDQISFNIKTNQTCSVTQDLFYEGVENYEFSELFIRIIPKCKVFLDIGANVGYFSLLGAKVNNDIKIYAFEPSTGPLHFLKQNVQFNKLNKRIEVIGKAVSDVVGILTFHSVVNKKYSWIEHNLNGSHSLQSQHGREKGLSYPVEVISLEQFKKDFNVAKIDLIKIDTECTEHLIFRSSMKLINQDRPLIFSEVYDVIKQEIHQEFVRMENYLLFQVSKGSIYPMESILDKAPIENEANYLFVPKEKVELIEDFITVR